MSFSLYELTNEYLEALNFLTDPLNNVDDDCLRDTLEGLSGALDDKILNVSRFISSIEIEAEAVEKIELRQRNRRQTLENTAQRLRDYLINSMSVTGHTSLKAPDISTKLVKLPVSVTIIDESLIPDTLWRSTTTRLPDKSSIKDLGGCPGTVIESKGYRVSIK